MNRIRVNAFPHRKAIASPSGPESPTTRLVLLALNTSMNTEGESCFPSTKTIAVKCSLTERTVCTHLELAHKNGWIEKNQCALGGREWRRNEYKATIPDKVLKEVQHLHQKALNLMQKALNLTTIRH